MLLLCYSSNMSKLTYINQGTGLWDNVQTNVTRSQMVLVLDSLHCQKKKKKYKRTFGSKLL